MLQCMLQGRMIWDDLERAHSARRCGGAPCMLALGEFHMDWLGVIAMVELQVTSQATFIDGR
jgi:hypothetical protein